MSHHNFKFVFAATAMASALAARGETLSQLTQEALRNNSEFRVLEATVAAAKGGVTTAKTWQNPELTAAPGVRQLKENNKSETLFHGEFGLNQLFKFPGKRALEIAVARRGVQAGELALEAFRFQLAAKV